MFSKHDAVTQRMGQVEQDISYNNIFKYRFQSDTFVRITKRFG